MPCGSVDCIMTRLKRVIEEGEMFEKIDTV
jgi:hypothetical protein